MSGATAAPAVSAALQTFLAFDFGARRTGVAFGTRLLGSGTPQRAQADPATKSASRQQTGHSASSASTVSATLAMPGGTDSASARAASIAR